MSFIILSLFVTSLVSHQVLCQEGDKLNAEGNGQQRAIYSQRHLSPHRMMHFGKRPSMLAPPTILTPQVYDPYVSLVAQQPAWRPRSLIQQQPDSPFLFTIELEQGRAIQALPEDSAPFETLQPSRDTLYNFERPQADQFGYNLAEQQSALKQAAGQALLGNRHKLMKLMENSNNDADGANGVQQTDSAERAQPSANALDDSAAAGGGGYQAQQQQSAINVSTRSMQNGSRLNSLHLPKAYISSLLFGRQGSSSLPNYASFNKKAEPKDNFFMHFGRK